MERQNNKRRKYMVNRLWYDFFVAYPISITDPYQPSALGLDMGVSSWYEVWYEKMACNNFYLFLNTLYSNSVCKKVEYNNDFWCRHVKKFCADVIYTSCVVYFKIFKLTFYKSSADPWYTELYWTKYYQELIMLWSIALLSYSLLWFDWLVLFHWYIDVKHLMKVLSVISGSKIVFPK